MNEMNEISFVLDFDALSNAAYCVPLRGRGAELEGALSFKSPPYQAVENCFLLFANNGDRINFFEQCRVNGCAFCLYFVFSEHPALSGVSWQIVAPILCVEVAIALSLSRIIVDISKSSREKQAVRHMPRKLMN